MNDRMQMILVLICVAGAGAYLGFKKQEKEEVPEPKKINVFGESSFTHYKEKEKVGFILMIPTNATILDKTVTQALHEEGSKLIEERSSNANAAKDRGYKSTTLVRIQIPPAKTGVAQLSPGLAIWHEETPEVLTHRDGPRYLKNLRRTMEDTSDVVYRDEIMTKPVDGRKIFIQVCAIKVTPEGGEPMEGIQEQYVIAIDGNALGMSATYNNQEEAKILRDMAFSIRFDKLRTRLHEDK